MDLGFAGGRVDGFSQFEFDRALLMYPVFRCGGPWPFFKGISVSTTRYFLGHVVVFSLLLAILVQYIEYRGRTFWVREKTVLCNIPPDLRLHPSI